MLEQNNLTPAQITARSLLSKGGGKETFHIELSGISFPYHPGDSIAIFASHDPELLEKTLKQLGFTGKEEVHDKRQNERCSLFTLLQQRRNITRLHLPLAAKIAPLPEDPLQAREQLQQFELWDFLQRVGTPSWSAQEWADALPPLLPRYYSIASARECVGDAIHLTVASADFHSGGHLRRGVGSHFLARIAEIGKTVIPLIHKPTEEFRLPSNPNAPIIMVGPGTGVAPFRAFMQRRYHGGELGRNWLFFGEWHREHHFFYEAFWQELVQKEFLQLDCAFSRDSQEKVYVQHKLLMHEERVWEWLQEGAYFYVCGDGEKMAKEVDQTLHKIVENKLGCPQGARLYIRDLRKRRRYLRDVY